MRNRRHKLWIDRFQTSLSIRIGLYFVFFEVIIGLTFTVGRAIILDFQEVLGVEAWGFLGLIALFTLALMAGLFIRDAIAYTHRIVGPLYRFRKAIQAIIAGDELELIRLRKGDHLQEFKMSSTKCCKSSNNGEPFN